MIVCIIVIIIIGIGSFFWASNNPDIVIGIGKPEAGSVKYVESVMLQCDRRFGIPISKEAERKAEEFSDKTSKMHQSIISSSNGPMHIEISVEIKDGKTIVTYFGTVTDSSGKLIDYSQSIDFPYVLSKQISEN